MPDRVVYNPFILGFLEEQGPVFMPLQEAVDIYGRLPSTFRLVSTKKKRREKKVLNLDLGKLIVELLADGEASLKAQVFNFFNSWHRDLTKEFDLNMASFWNLTRSSRVLEIVRANQAELAGGAALDLRAYLSDRFIRKDVLNSIPAGQLDEKAGQIITRKMKTAGSWRKEDHFRKGLNIIRATALLDRIKSTTGLDFDQPSDSLVRIFADEIAATLIAMHRHMPLRGIEKLIPPGGDAISFAFATRDQSYLELGKQTGDCTSDKSPFQADRDIENIYWTVFPWILDRNYQILKVFYRGNFIMKAHLAPLFVVQETGGEMILAVDAVETVRAFRDDMREQSQDSLLEQKTSIFEAVVAEVLRIADSMGIKRVYAERFSNTPWVRQAFEAYPEIYLQVDQIVKLDELEDVYYLAQALAKTHGFPKPLEIFMELQMKNTSLLPRVTKKLEGVKPFAVLKGGMEGGIPMKRVFGI